MRITTGFISAGSFFNAATRSHRLSAYSRQQFCCPLSVIHTNAHFPRNAENPISARFCVMPCAAITSVILSASFDVEADASVRPGDFGSSISVNLPVSFFDLPFKHYGVNLHPQTSTRYWLTTNDIDFIKLLVINEHSRMRQRIQRCFQDIVQVATTLIR